MATDQIHKTDEQWREELTPEQYDVLRKGGTERAFTGKYWNDKQDGVYRCAGCGAELFSSDTKFDSGTGWPSFTEPAVAAAVETAATTRCSCAAPRSCAARCGGHLGHVFEDGPQPTRAACATASTRARSSSIRATAQRASPTRRNCNR